MGSPNDSVNLPVLTVSFQQVGCNSREQPWFPSWSHHPRFTVNVTFFQKFALGTTFQAVLLKFWKSFCRATEDQTLVYFHKPELLYSSLPLQVILSPTEMWDLLSKMCNFYSIPSFFYDICFPHSSCHKLPFIRSCQSQLLGQETWEQETEFSCQLLSSQTSTQCLAQTWG